MQWKSVRKQSSGHFFCRLYVYDDIMEMISESGKLNRAGERQRFMKEQFSRSRMLLGEEAMDRLAASRVAVFGVGGVGGFAVEALARAA